MIGGDTVPITGDSHADHALWQTILTLSVCVIVGYLYHAYLEETHRSPEDLVLSGSTEGGLSCCWPDHGPRVHPQSTPSKEDGDSAPEPGAPSAPPAVDSDNLEKAQ